MKPHILVAPLNWGLGHATRSIPIIDYLLERGCTVSLAGDGRALQLLQHQYPSLSSWELPAYNAVYAKNGYFVLGLLPQIPHILRAIRAEHTALAKLIDTHKIDGVISDNRYGLWSDKVPTAFICHQLALLLPPLMSWMRYFVYRLHLSYIQRFGECWIPDTGDDNNLSGKLSHQYALPASTHFLGSLSRFAYTPEAAAFSYPELDVSELDILVVLSGPEPQRSLFQELVRKQALLLNRKVWIVEGKPELRRVEKEANLYKISFMGTNDLALAYRKAKVVVSRSGYSSLLDYAAIGCEKLILIPTPGQTEQEYLAKRLSKNHIAVSQPQSAFALSQCLQEVEHMKGFPLASHPKRMKQVVDCWLENIQGE